MSLAMSPTPTTRTCGTMVVHRNLLSSDARYVAARNRIENLSLQFEEGVRKAAPRGVTRIPVVFHVVYNSDDQNVSDEQIHSQLEVLNNDFRMANSDIGNVPDPFKPFVADAEVEFKLAERDPDGSVTSGITRTRTDVTEFSAAEQAVKSAGTGGHDPWPSDRYLNIWVCRLGQGLLGYAHFPGAPAEIDGVVILHTAFGTMGTAAAPFNLGRTATHEVGHWLNLRHIWGGEGNGCQAADFVADTPNQAEPNQGVPEFPHVSCNNGPDGDMFMNYMDYTDDVCMCMFTAGQIARMESALEGPRSSLLKNF